VDDQKKSFKPKEKKSESSIHRSLRTVDLILGHIRRFDDSRDLWKGVVEKSLKLEV
jgi:hypothetical protein